MSQKLDLNLANLTKSQYVNFSGTVVEKLPNAAFSIKLTNFGDGTPVPKNQPDPNQPGKDVRITATLMGKVKNKIRIAIHDTVLVAISMETAQNKSGMIIYREKKPGATPFKFVPKK